MSTTGRFAGQAVVVTGGGHGIGRACVERLAAEGARVAVADLDLEAATAVAAGLPGGHVAVELDVTSASSVDEAFSRAATGLGSVDALVNVAGGDVPHGSFEETPDETWAALLDLNLVGVARTCRAAVPLLRDSRGVRAIVNISSVNALTSLGSEPYSAAKAGLLSLTRNLAIGLAGDRIRVNAVAPGTIRTRVWDDQEGGADRMLHLYPLGRVGEPADIAAAVAFLASADASWVTGHVLPVDGGLLARP